MEFLIVTGEDPRDPAITARRCLAAAAAAARFTAIGPNASPGGTPGMSSDWSFVPVTTRFDPVLDFWLTGERVDLDAVFGLEPNPESQTAPVHATPLMFARASADPIEPSVDPLADLVPIPPVTDPMRRTCVMLAAAQVLREIGASSFDREAAADAILLEAARLAA